MKFLVSTLVLVFLVQLEHAQADCGEQVTACQNTWYAAALAAQTEEARCEAAEEWETCLDNIEGCENTDYPDTLVTEEETYCPTGAAQDNASDSNCDVDVPACSTPWYEDASAAADADARCAAAEQWKTCLNNLCPGRSEYPDNLNAEMDTYCQDVGVPPAPAAAPATAPAASPVAAPAPAPASLPTVPAYQPVGVPPAVPAYPAAAAPPVVSAYPPEAAPPAAAPAVPAGQPTCEQKEDECRASYQAEIGDDCDRAHHWRQCVERAVAQGICPQRQDTYPQDLNTAETYGCY